MTEREQVEYSALRATIRERGTARVYTFAGGIAAWAALALAAAALASTPLATLLPLLVLAAIFEAVFALHVGVERVGRYVQVFYEAHAAPPPVGAAGPGTEAPATMASAATDAAAGWEHAAMAFGRPQGAATADPLFSLVFLLATLFNVAPALVVGPTRAELVFVAGAHALLVIRIVVARDAAKRQRAIDLARFEALRQHR